eukprot:2768631-Rhodomonas_salina.4
MQKHPFNPLQRRAVLTWAMCRAQEEALGTIYGAKYERLRQVLLNLARKPSKQPCFKPTFCTSPSAR